MKKTIKLALLACLTLLVSALMFTACDITDFLPISVDTSPEKTTIADPSFVETTPAVTSPEETTPEETTPEETTPEETTPSIGEHAHTWSEWITIQAAKCEEIGLTQRYCTVCFYTESRPINALGHTEVLDEAVTPTCTVIGLTEGKHCSVCNKVFVAQEVIPAKNHQYENYVCTRCGESQYIIFGLSFEGHSYKVLGVESDYPSSLVIPSTYLGKPVTSIGTYAFDGCSRLTSITIPDSVTSIGERAFYYCSSLTSITIPDSVTSIGDYAFYGCSRLESITMPLLRDETPKFLRNIFGGNIPASLKAVAITSGTNIFSSAFDGCSSLTSITIPDSVTTIGVYTFYGCSSLTSITIPDGVTNINSAMFYSCSSLTSITIPDSVTSIGERAFSDCSSLTSITIPDSVTIIGDYAFSDCSSLTSITIPDSVTIIGDYAFYGCSSLTSITIPDGVTNINSATFYSCSSLTSITIPDSVTSISNHAFSLCSNLTSITFEGTITQWKAITFGSYWNGRVPATEVVCSDGTVTLN